MHSKEEVSNYFKSIGFRRYTPQELLEYQEDLSRAIEVISSNLSRFFVIIFE